MNTPAVFTPYQKLVVALLAFLQFTIVLDFMILSPLGAMLLEQLHITTQQFGLVVSAYAFSAGASGLLAAGFADRFDRKRLLLFFYVGFLVGTLCCGLAPDYRSLLIARIVTGLFGGVIGSISMAIVADLFGIEVRGRVMGVVQSAFAASQVLGIPLGLWLSTRWGWHAPFLLITAVGVAVGFVILFRVRPIDAHLRDGQRRNAFKHLLSTVARRPYLKGFAATIFLATGGFMLMPFGSAFAVNNLGVSLHQLPSVYVATGAFALIGGPIIGRISDSVGKYRTLFVGTVVGALLVLAYVQLGRTPLWIVITLNVILFLAISARMISASALTSEVPAPQDRGAYMSVNSSVQQISGGVASALAGLIVVQTQSGKIERYDVLGYVVVLAMLATLGFMYSIHRMIAARRRGPVAGGEIVERPASG
ncbi:MAG TPA: MFS transporter [Polyangiaceae bacterium]|nr:MFS transporter [Polyangiaceae bacterium]